jgi:type II secretory pathway pseudopilin PulG
MSFLNQHVSQIRFKSQQGATLVEELVAVAIIGMGIVILIAMITTGVIGVRQIDDKVVAESLARSQLELIKNASYQPDPVSNPYPGVTPIPNYSVAVEIEYWEASSSRFVSGLRNDGLQKIIVTITSDGTTLTQTAAYKVDR